MKSRPGGRAACRRVRPAAPAGPARGSRPPGPARSPATPSPARDGGPPGRPCGPAAADARLACRDNRRYPAVPSTTPCVRRESVSAVPLTEVAQLQASVRQFRHREQAADTGPARHALPPDFTMPADLTAPQQRDQIHRGVWPALLWTVPNRPRRPGTPDHCKQVRRPAGGRPEPVQTRRADHATLGPDVRFRPWADDLAALVARCFQSLLRSSPPRPACSRTSSRELYRAAPPERLDRSSGQTRKARPGER